MAIVDCPKCGDPNFDNGACGCGWCKECTWRTTCTQGEFYAPDFGKPLKLMNNFAPGDFPTPIGLPEVEHTWHNLYSDEPTFICKCGDEFETHEKLMAHTAELNPKLDTLTMGSAGAAIEREAHTKTLDLLRRARKALRNIDFVMDHLELHHGPSCRQVIPGEPYYDCKCGLRTLEAIQLKSVEPLLRDIREQCSIFTEEDDQEFERVLDEQIARGDFKDPKDLDCPLPPEEGYE